MESQADFVCGLDLRFEQVAGSRRKDVVVVGRGRTARKGQLGEPSLGSTATINQEAWSFGGTYDREQGTTRRFREEPKVPSICNVTLLDGSKLVVE